MGLASHSFGSGASYPVNEPGDTPGPSCGRHRDRDGQIDDEAQGGWDRRSALTLALPRRAVPPGVTKESFA